MSKTAPLVYNPREESPEVLEQILVGRDGILKELLDDLANQAGSATRQHWLICGPRGMGKTHLVAILYHRISRSPALSARFLPVWLSEATAYDAYSAGMLLLAIAHRLVEQLEETNDAGAADLRSAVAQKAYKGDDPALFNDLCQLLKEEAGTRGIIFVVLMENLGAWLDNASGHRGNTEARKLRSLLSDDKEFLFICTTPTCPLPKLSKPGSPLFGHLRERRLRPMTEEDLRELFHRLSRIAGRDADGADGLDRPQARLRWRVLHRLAGGNPRAAVMAFRVISHATGIRAIVQELNDLLDLQTAYYEAKLARLAPRERAIVRVLALSPTTLTVSEMAEQSRLPERSLSTQVKRLLDEGHIVPAGDERGKGSVFELSDGLFRTWYHYRSGAHRELEPLVRFLAMWHTERELELSLLSLREDLAMACSPLERNRLESTAIQIYSALGYARSPLGTFERAHLWDKCAREIGGSDAGAAMAEVPASSGVAEGGPESLPEQGHVASEIGATGGIGPSEQVALASTIVKHGLSLVSSGRFEEAYAAFRDVIAHFGDDSECSSPVIGAIINLGVTLGLAGRREEAINAYRDAISRLRGSVEPWSRVAVAFATVQLGDDLDRAGRQDEAAAAYRDIINGLGDSPEGPSPDLKMQTARARVNLGNALAHAGRLEEAITAYRDAISRFEHSPEPIFRETVARAMYNLGCALQQAGQGEEAIATYRDLIARFGDCPGFAFQDQVVSGMYNLGTDLGQIGRLDESVTVLRDLVARFGESPQPAFQEQVASAIYNLAASFSRSGRHEEEIAAYRDLIRRFAGRAGPALREQVARAMFYLGVTFGRIGQREDAIATYRDLINRFAGCAELELQKRVSEAMCNLSLLLEQEDRVCEVEAVVRDALARFGASEQPALRRQVASVMHSLAVSFHRSGRRQEGIAIYSDLLRRFGDSVEPLLQGPIALAMFNLYGALYEAGRSEEAIATYRDLVGRFRGNAEPQVRERVATAMFNYAAGLQKAGQGEEAIATFRDLISTFGDSKEPGLEERVARGICALGNALEEAGKQEEALAAWRGVITRFGRSEEPTIVEDVGRAMHNLGIVLWRAGQHEQAIAAFRDLATRFEGTAVPSLQMIADNARLDLARSLSNLGRNGEAAEVAVRLADPTASVRNPQVGITARLILADQLQWLGKRTEARLAVVDAAHRLAEAPSVAHELCEQVFMAMLVRLPFNEAKELLDEILSNGDPARSEMVQFYRFLLDVLIADAPATGKTKLGPVARRKRTLARVPQEVRVTVEEKAELIRQRRQDWQK